jgi:hypothetical protein
MSKLTPLLREIDGIVSDRARDRLPTNAVWGLVDYVPMILQAGARIRGAWLWQSDALTNAPDGMIYAPFKAGARLLVANGSLLTVVPTSSIGHTDISGAINPTRQNPFIHNDRVIIPDTSGGNVARVVTFDGTNYTIAGLPASSIPGRYGTVWLDRTVLANTAANPFVVAFSKVNNPTSAWDSLSQVNTNFPVTGVAGMQTQVLVFHDSSVERLRGSTPPDSTLSDQAGDLIRDTLYDRAGCYDARSIGFWNTNVIFADARGIHLTDGASVRTITLQGGASNLWRSSWTRGGNPPLTAAAVVHRDYYLITLRHTGFPPITIVADMTIRRVFQLGNIDAGAFAYATAATERLYATKQSVKRVIDITPVFSPDPTVLQVDAYGTSVLPSIQTGWSMLTKSEGWKRIHDVHLAYEAYRDDDLDVFRAYYVNAPTGADQALGEFKPTPKFVRRKIPVRRRLMGIAVRLDQLQPTRDSRIYDISLRAYPESEETDIRVRPA